ncbi:hypothetical protein [Massilia sp. Leaf139]|uniref:hypothetical protein n=1 Tax=Massilia sp. Leaf139 TaxID=1736272 RepID=UPI0012E7F766|nr:hypothetical protein [Massilia sp. Leaf139]
MSLARQHLMRFVAVLALGAASASAFAQSAEYRRGYDDGFAAGQRAGRDDYGRPGGGNRLHIERAEYGARGAMCDARRAVRQEMERNGGAVRADNGLCGDPAIGVGKRLTVVYRCGDDQPQQVSTRENDTLRLSCRR